jgi:ketosteroid isomerase-like protein
MSARDQHRQEIAAVVEQYRRGFTTMDVEVLQAIWDQGYDNLIYIAQEMALPVCGWAGIERYYRRVASFVERVRSMTVSDVSVELFGDVAYAFCLFHFEGEAKGQHHIADGRVTFILHRTSGTWKVIHYHESAPGPFGRTEDA